MKNYPLGFKENAKYCKIHYWLSSGIIINSLKLPRTSFSLFESGESFQGKVGNPPMPVSVSQEYYLSSVFRAENKDAGVLAQYDLILSRSVCMNESYVMENIWTKDDFRDHR